MMPAPSRRRIVKKVVGGHGHHGGAWKVAYADFVTAMMALFMIMWLLASTDQKSREEISRYFRTGILPDGSMAMNSAAQVTPSVIERSPMPPPRGKASLEDEVQQLQNRIENMAKLDGSLGAIARHVKVRMTDAGILLEIVDEEGGGLLFDTASSQLKPALSQFLAMIAPTVGAMGSLEINGHTDALPFVHGAGKSNWDLSYERASAARVILEDNGVESGQVRAVIGRGASELLVPSQPFSARNRRLSILMLHADVPSRQTDEPAPKAEPAAAPAPATAPEPAAPATPATH